MQQNLSDLEAENAFKLQVSLDIKKNYLFCAKWIKK